MSQARSIADAARFRGLHEGPRALVLPNVWDALSAFLFAGAGAQAIATASIPVAWSQGYADGEKIPFETLVRTVKAITRSTSLPVSIDLEAGFSDDPQAVVEHVACLVELGVAGINLEDGAKPPALLGAKIAACKADPRTRHVFVNARTDVYLHNLVLAEEALDETLARSARYEEAGADGLFVPRVSDAAETKAIVLGTRLPVNVFGGPGADPITALEGFGVRRISMGPKLALVAYGAALAACREQLGDRARDDAPKLDILALNRALGALAP